MSSPIPSSVQEVLDLFASDLAEVRFPGLEQSVLDAAAEQTMRAASELRRAEEAVEAARSTLTEAQEALLHKAQRALAYLRIYAEDDSSLAARLEAIALPRTPRRSPRAEGGRAEPCAEPSQRQGALALPSESGTVVAGPVRRRRGRRDEATDTVCDPEEACAASVG